MSEHLCAGQVVAEQQRDALYWKFRLDPDNCRSTEEIRLDIDVMESHTVYALSYAMDQGAISGLRRT